MTLKKIKELICLYTRCRYNQREFFQAVFPRDILNGHSDMTGDVIEFTSNSGGWLSKLYNNKADIKSGSARVQRIISENLRTNNKYLSAISNNCNALISKENVDRGALCSKLSSEAVSSEMTPDMAKYVADLLHTAPANGIAACIVYSCCHMDDRFLMELLQNTYGENPVLPVSQDASLKECIKYLHAAFMDCHTFAEQCALKKQEWDSFDLHKLDACQSVINHIRRKYDPSHELLAALDTLYRDIQRLYYNQDLHPSDGDLRFLGKLLEQIIALKDNLDSFQEHYI